MVNIHSQLGKQILIGYLQQQHGGSFEMRKIAMTLIYHIIQKIYSRLSEKNLNELKIQMKLAKYQNTHMYIFDTIIDPEIQQKYRNAKNKYLKFAMDHVDNENFYRSWKRDSFTVRKLALLRRKLITSRVKREGHINRQKRYKKRRLENLKYLKKK